MSNAMNLTTQQPLLLRLWLRVREPRVVSVLYFLIYGVLGFGGVAAMLNPPSTIEGQIGVMSMYMLAGLLTFGSIVGLVAVLPGIWWLERTAVLAIGAAAAIYGFIILGLQFSESGNRLLQLSFVATVLLMQAVRWHRIHERPYDPTIPRTH